MGKLICPKCNSTDISTDNTVIGREITSQPSYVCNTCGYSAFVFPELEKAGKKPAVKHRSMEIPRQTEKKKGITLLKIIIIILIISTGIVPGLIILAIYRSLNKHKESNNNIDADEKELEKADRLIEEESVDID